MVKGKFLIIVTYKLSYIFAIVGVSAEAPFLVLQVLFEIFHKLSGKSQFFWVIHFHIYDIVHIGW